MLEIMSDNREIPTNFIKFSDGAISYKLNELSLHPKYINIRVCPTTPVNAIMEELEMVVSALKESYGTNCIGVLNFPISLHIPYLPYARGDRVFEVGNPHPLKTFIERLHNLRFDEIFVCDIHNINAINQLKNQLECGDMKITMKTQLDCFKDSQCHNFSEKYPYDVVVAPDNGARNKARYIANYLEAGFRCCEKERDVSTGQIKGINLPDNYDYKGMNVLIPDDILDGGGTFIPIAKELKKRGANRVDLYITHMIGFKGLEIFEGVIDNIHVHHIVGKHLVKQQITEFNNREKGNV